MTRTMRFALMGLVVVCTLLVAIRPLHALERGNRVSGMITLGRAQVPLPEGSWVVVGLGAQDAANPPIFPLGGIVSAVLARIEARTVVTLLEINANAAPVEDGWGRARICVQDQASLTHLIRYAVGAESSCHAVTVTTPDDSGPAAWQDARAWLRNADVALPALMLTAAFRVTDRHDLVDARFHFDPSQMIGAAALDLGQPSDWTGQAVDSDPARLAAVKMISRWADGFDGWIERGLHRQLGPADTAQMPWTATFSGAVPTVDAALRDLDRRYRDGQIGWASYVEQSRKASHEPPRSPAAGPSIWARLNQAAPARILGTGLDYALAYAVTTDALQSLWIALTISATDTAWSLYNGQRSGHARQDERLVDFVYIGSGGTARAPEGK